VNSFAQKIKNLAGSFGKASPLKKIVIIVICVGILWMLYGIFLKPKQAQNYTTVQAERGTLVVSAAESGTVAVANRVSISTQTSGTINNVYVKNGDEVTAGEKIADLTLDSNGLAQQAQAYSQLLSAENNLKSQQAQLDALQVTLFKTNQAFVTDRGVINPSANQQADPVYIEENAAWLKAQADYINQQGVIAQAQAAVNSASLSYNSVSSSITAPVDGVISDITIAPGLVIANSQSASNNSISSQVVASIKHSGTPIISVSLSEIDVTKIKAGERATITFDALPNQTFTGKVLGIDTTGTVSSGVTSYPATIALDSENDKILPNMSVSANIITSVKDNVLLVPAGAVTTRGTQSIVYTKKNGQIQSVDVTIGDSDGTNTEITSGLSEGDSVLVGYSPISTTGSGATTSPFSRSIFGGNAGFGGGVRVGGGGGGAGRTGGGAAGR
jgi:macrolide-specific efflux system membrane fusion protein